MFPCLAEYSDEEGTSVSTPPPHNHHQERSPDHTSQPRPKHLALELEAGSTGPEGIRKKGSVTSSQEQGSNTSSPQAKSHDGHMTSRKERERRDFSVQQHNLHSTSTHHTGLSSKSGVTMATEAGGPVEDQHKHAPHRGGEQKNVGVAGEDLSTVISEKPGDIFELFRTKDGEEFTVYVREDGTKFYVDFEEQVRE